MTAARQKISEILPGFLLTVSVMIFFWTVIASGKPLFGSDFLLHFYPWKKFIYDHVHTEGAIPFWNPHVLSGTPCVGNIQTSMFYPFGFLFYILPTKFAYGYTIILHFMFGALFMYAFGRSLSLTRSGALLAAVVFTFNGFFVAHLYAGHLTLVQNYIWIPLIFLYLQKFIATHSYRYALLSGFFMGIQILGGFPQIAFYTIFAMILFCFFQFFFRLTEESRIAFRRLLLGLAAILFLGFGLAAVQVLPTYEFSQLSTRAGSVSYEFATVDSFDPVNFLTLLMPNFFGNPANGSYWKSANSWEFWELCAYVGIVPLLLICFSGKGNRTRHVRSFFIFLLLLTLFLSLGRHNPLYRYIYLLPGFNHFRIPAQILYLYVFSASVLAGMGLDRVSKLHAPSAFYKTVVVIGLGFFGLLITARRFLPSHFFYHLFKITGHPPLSPDLLPQFNGIVRLSLFTGTSLFVVVSALIILHCKRLFGSKTLVITLLVVAATDLWAFSNPMIRTTKLDLSVKKSSLIETIQADHEPCRVVTVGNQFHANDGLLYGYEDIHGYDPLILKRYLEFLNKSQDIQTPAEAVNVQYVRELDNNLIRTLNVKYRLSDTATWKLEDYLPRAFVVHKAVILPRNRILSFMKSDAFKPEEMVVLERLQTRTGAPVTDVAMSGEKRDNRLEENFFLSGSKDCRILEMKNNEITLTVDAETPGYLFLSEINYPGWKAYIDGRKVEVLTGNYIFRTIPIPSGSHEIVVRFAPVSFKIGLAISCASLLFFLLSHFARFIWKKQ